MWISILFRKPFVCLDKHFSPFTFCLCEIASFYCSFRYWPQNLQNKLFFCCSKFNCRKVFAAPLLVFFKEIATIIISYCHLAPTHSKEPIFIVLSKLYFFQPLSLSLLFFLILTIRSEPPSKPSVFSIIITTENVDNNTKGGKVYTVCRPNNKIIVHYAENGVFCFHFRLLRCAFRFYCKLYDLVNATDMIYEFRS